jgi:hypothetical protein
MRILILLLIPGFLLTTACGKVITIRQGSVSIQVPAPQGFEAMATDEKEFKEWRVIQESAGNEVCALFLRSPRAGNEGDFARQLEIGIKKSLKNASLTKALLHTMRQTFSDHPDEVLKGAKDSSGNSDFVIEPVHDFGDYHFSYLIRLNADNCVVQTMATIRGRLWIISVKSLDSASPRDVTWAKTTAKSWVNSIIKANPSDPAVPSIEQRNDNPSPAPERPRDPAYETGKIAGYLLVALLVIYVVKRFTRSS